MSSNVNSLYHHFAFNGKEKLRKQINNHKKVLLIFFAVLQEMISKIFFPNKIPPVTKNSKNQSRRVF
uniref:Uncharacterized protein n=1 Tax=Panagrolaimus sp. JU765 TaxID=591449 RepID=A0AC34QSK4_9BILA